MVDRRSGGLLKGRLLRGSFKARISTPEGGIFLKEGRSAAGSLRTL